MISTTYIYKTVNLATFAEYICNNRPDRIAELLKYQQGVTVPDPYTPSDLKNLLYDLVGAHTSTPLKPLAGWWWLTNNLLNWWEPDLLGANITEIAAQGPLIADLQKPLKQSYAIRSQIYTGP